MNNNFFRFHLQQGLQGQRVSDYTLPVVWSFFLERNIEEVFHHHLLIEHLDASNGNAVKPFFRALQAPVDHQDRQ